MNYKRCKMGAMPGELCVQTKIRMLESDDPIEVFPWQTIGMKAMKIFRKERKRRAKVKFREWQRKEIDAQLDECA